MEPKDQISPTRLSVDPHVFRSTDYYLRRLATLLKLINTVPQAAMTALLVTSLAL